MTKNRVNADLDSLINSTLSLVGWIRRPSITIGVGIGNGMWSSECKYNRVSSEHGNDVGQMFRVGAGGADIEGRYSEGGRLGIGSACARKVFIP